MSGPFSGEHRGRAGAWHGGLSLSQATWGVGESAGRTVVDTASVHELLRRSGLPHAELLHMGWFDMWLSCRAPVALLAATVAPLLGRVVLDYREELWTEAPTQWARAARLGEQVIDDWFWS